MSDLKRELTRFKESESHSTRYIADLEVRLARSDESVLVLRQTVEKLESECERRRDEAEILQERLENLKKDGEDWRTDLEEREQRVKELEKKMEEWEVKRKAAGEARERLAVSLMRWRRPGSTSRPTSSTLPRPMVRAAVKPRGPQRPGSRTSRSRTSSLHSNRPTPRPSPIFHPLLPNTAMPCAKSRTSLLKSRK